MGRGFATDLASMDNINMETAIKIHLTSNFYPPVPSSMVEPCVHAINSYREDDLSRLIILPDGVFWRGQNTAPAHAVIEQHRLYPWIEESE